MSPTVLGHAFFALPLQCEQGRTYQTHRTHQISISGQLNEGDSIGLSPPSQYNATAYVSSPRRSFYCLSARPRTHSFLDMIGGEGLQPAVLYSSNYGGLLIQWGLSLCWRYKWSRCSRPVLERGSAQPEARRGLLVDPHPQILRQRHIFRC
jgi:hypothetical protein